MLLESINKLGLDEDFLTLSQTLDPQLQNILVEIINDLKGRIGIALHENNQQNFESMSDSKRYLPILELLINSDSEDSNIQGCRKILSSHQLRIVDACAGEQLAIKAFLSELNTLIQKDVTKTKKVILDIYDKNLDPTLLISKYELPSKNFELDELKLRDARDKYDINPNEPTITFISYSDLYNTQEQYAQMILNALEVSDIVVILPGTFSLVETEIIPRIIYKKDGKVESFLLK